MDAVSQELIFIYCIIVTASMAIPADVDDYLKLLSETIDKIDKNCLNEAIGALLKVREEEGTVYIFGNGGSAATASHIVCDFNKGVSLNLDRKFRFVCLSDSTSTVTAIANDIGYDEIFRLQLKGRLKKNDLVFAISGSGNSKNVINAVEYAREQGVKVLSLTGYSGGKLLKLSDYPIHVSVDNMQIAEDAHMMVCHLMASVIARHLGEPMC